MISQYLRVFVLVLVATLSLSSAQAAPQTPSDALSAAVSVHGKLYIAPTPVWFPSEAMGMQQFIIKYLTQEPQASFKSASLTLNTGMRLLSPALPQGCTAELYDGVLYQDDINVGKLAFTYRGKTCEQFFKTLDPTTMVLEFSNVKVDFSGKTLNIVLFIDKLQ